MAGRVFLKGRFRRCSVVPQAELSRGRWPDFKLTHQFRDDPLPASGKSWLVAGCRTSNVRVSEERVSFVRSVVERGDVAAASSSALIFFKDDDAAYLEWLARNRDGYVVNVRRGLSSDYVVLHRASCTTISAAQEPGAYTERGYRKLCGRTLADVAGAPTWCGRAKGSFTKRCSTCGA